MSILCQQHTVSITVTFNKLWNWNVWLLQFCSSFSELFWPFGSLAIAYECKDHLFHFCKHFWNVDRDCVESVNRGITILTILSFLIHEYRTSFRLFQSSFLQKCLVVFSLGMFLNYNVFLPLLSMTHFRSSKKGVKLTGKQSIFPSFRWHPPMRKKDLQITQYQMSIHWQLFLFWALN